jgi:hypothetical protein
VKYIFPVSRHATKILIKILISRCFSDLKIIAVAAQKEAIQFKMTWKNIDEKGSYFTTVGCVRILQILLFVYFRIYRVFDKINPIIITFCLTLGTF